MTASILQSDRHSGPVNRNEILFYTSDSFSIQFSIIPITMAEVMGTALSLPEERIASIRFSSSLFGSTRAQISPNFMIDRIFKSGKRTPLYFIKTR